MDPIQLAFLALAVLTLLVVLRVPVAAAMLAVGMVGYVALSSADALFAYMKSGVYWRFAAYDLSVIPMFILMGQLATHSGLSRQLFSASNGFLGHRRGGVAMAAVGGCGAFGAICGSSLATAGTMAKVALPELRRYNYSGALATGALAAGGTLGILIPPSIVLIVYAVAVQANIVRMFEAALLPGVLALLGYLITIAIYVRIQPSAGETKAPASSAERCKAVRQCLPTAFLFLLVIGGIYLGWFDPTEAAGIGVVGILLLGRLQGELSRHDFVDCLSNTAVTTAMIFMVVLGADFLNIFLALADFPAYISALAAASDLSPYILLVMLLGFYFLLGCFMDSLAMMILTVPIFWPIVAALDFGMPIGDLQIWFGILVLVVVELGLITPPIGLNTLIINSHAFDVPLRETWKGVLPFLLADLLRIIVLLAFPSVVLWLPHWLSRMG